jgi:hypothetical protein
VQQIKTERGSSLTLKSSVTLASETYLTYFSHLIGNVGLCFNLGLDTGMIAIRIGNSSSEGAGWMSSKWRHPWKLFKINPVLSSLVFVPRLTTPSTDFYDHDAAGKSRNLSVQWASVGAHVSILCCLISVRTVFGGPILTYV